MEDISSEIGSAESLIAELANEYIERLERGEQPDIEEYVARWPGDARVVRQVLASLNLVRLSSVAEVSEAALETADAAGRLGDFQILREIGRGGMGVVYEAEQISLGRRIALKILPFAGVLDPRQLQRFKNEALAAAQLDHPNIVDVIAVGCERGVHYYAMRLIDGQTLAEVIARLASGSRERAGSTEGSQRSEAPDQVLGLRSSVLGASGDDSDFDNRRRKAVGRRPKAESPTAALAPALPPSGSLSPPRPLALSPPHDETAPTSPARDTAISRTSTIPTHPPREYFRSVARLMAEAAEALNHAHQLGVVHRDIKPSNLMLDSRGKLWVTDFGLAHVESNSEMTMTGDLLGTLRYMSPEQASGNRQLLDHRTDIYSLGATLYELLTLRPAFGSLDRQSLLRQITDVEPPAPKKIRSAIPTDLQTIALKSLEKEPSQRYGTAGDMADDLRRYLDDKPIRARRPGIADRARKWSRRHSGLVGASSALMLVAVIVLAVSNFRINAALKTAHDATESEKAARLAATKAADQEREQRMVAEEARRRAEKEQRVARAVRMFLQRDLLRQADPRAQADAVHETGGGFDTRENPTIKELINRAAAELAPERIEAKFPDMPLVQAEILATIGDTYRGLGDFEEAIDYYGRATDLFARELGDEHPDTLACRSKLASEYTAAGNLELAIPLLQRTLEARRAKLGADDLATRTTETNLAAAYLFAGRLDLAIPLFERLLEEHQKSLGTQHQQTLVLQNNLANAYRKAGKLDLAIPLFESSLAAREAGMGADHPLTLAARKDLALAYQDTGKLNLAIPLLERTLVSTEAKMGHDHPQTLDVCESLGMAYRATGKLNLAIPLLERALNAREANFGDDHPDTLACRNYLAIAYLDSGRMDVAVPLFERTLNDRRTKLGNNHPDTIESMQNLAIVYARVRQFDGAVQLYEELLTARQEKLGRDHPETLHTQASLGVNYRAAGRVGDSMALIEEALERGRELPGALPGRLHWILQDVGKTYLLAGHPEKGLPLFTEFLDARRNALGAEANEFAGLLAQVAADLLRQGQAVYVEPLLRECLAIREKNQPDAWGTFNARSMLGASLLGQKKYADAEPLLVSAYEGLRQREASIPPPGKIRLPEALERLIQLYEAWERPEEAAKWRAADPLSLAQLAVSRKQYRAAMELFRQVFAAQSDLEADLNKAHRYNAACAAALAAEGQGADVAEDTAESRNGWRKQALEWLRADLNAWKKRLTDDADAARPEAIRTLAHWQHDPDLKSVRDEAALAALPPDERNAWQTLWSDVATMSDSAKPRTTAAASSAAAPQPKPRQE